MADAVAIKKVDQTTADLLITYTKASTGNEALTVAFSYASYAGQMIPFASIALSIYQQQQAAKAMADLKRDIGNMIAAAVDELKRFIVETLDQRDVVECQAYVNGCWRALKDYNNAHNKEKSAHRLDAADFEVNGLYKYLRTFRKRGLLAFVDAISLKMIVLQTRAVANADPGEITNAREIIDEAKQHISDCLHEALAAWDKRIAGIGPVVDRPLWGIPFRENDTISMEPYAAYTDDEGKLRASWGAGRLQNIRGGIGTVPKEVYERAMENARANAHKARKAHIEAYETERQKMIEQLHVPCLAAIDRWIASVNAN